LPSFWLTITPEFCCGHSLSDLAVTGNRASLATTAVVAILLFGLGLYFGVRTFERQAEMPDTIVDIGTSAMVLPHAKPLPDFTLIDSSGRTFDRDSFKGRWTFLFFGYTHCPDVCPTTLGMLTQVEKALQIDAELTQPNYVFISVDPLRDTPEHLARYMSYFSPSFVGVTGADDQLLRLSRSLGILYHRHADGEAGDYLIDHSASILLVDPGASLRSVHPAPHDSAAIVDDYRKIVATFGDDSHLMSKDNQL
jgi:cytochrome oxidase Cu insertion factor (SCO1/SenC/PrrC family)